MKMQNSPSLGDISDELKCVLTGVSSVELDHLTSEIQKAPRVFVAGAGRSGLIARAFAMRLMHIGKCVYVVGETVTPGVLENDLLIILSGSGTTASMQLYCRKAQDIGAEIFLITASLDSALAEQVSASLVVPSGINHFAGERKTIQPMDNVFEQSMLIVLDYAIMILMERMNIDDDQMRQRHANLE
jgi:6-phospho-3-hexuloisomerase